MKISEIKPNTGKIEVEGEVVEKEDARDITTKFGKKLKLANATLKDVDGGTVKLTLWGEDADNVTQGMKIKIENGWASEFQGEVQLSAGKFGKIIVL